MLRKIFIVLVLVVAACWQVEAKTKGPKWIYHFTKEGQTIEQIVRGYSVLYDVDMKKFTKWNKIEASYVAKDGDIFLIANKPSKQIRDRLKQERRNQKKSKVRKRTKQASQKFVIDNDDVLSAIRFAGNETGVRHAFLAGMLYVETGLGQNTGTCHYQKAKMGIPEQNLFVQICQELGYDPEKLGVSCPQKGQRGGAIGVAQFLPSTWEKYKSRIAKVVGKDIPDPWVPKDAVVAMALKVADDAPGVTAHKKAAEINAAKMYLSGTTDKKYNSHARKVLAAAKRFEDQF